MVSGGDDGQGAAAQAEQAAQAGYLLGSGSGERERLRDLLEDYGQKRLLALVQPGAQVLDVGCGPGAVSAVLAEAVGPEGRVVGVDLQLAQLELAREYCAERGLENVSFQPADATALPFADASFDLVYAKFLLLHLPEPAPAVREMVRVLRPGGRLFVHDLDAGACLFWPEDTPAHRAWQLIVRVLAEGGADPNVGRKLYQHLKHAGLTEVRVIPELAASTVEQRRLLRATKRQFAGLLESLRERILSGGYASHGDLKALVMELIEDYSDELITTAAFNAHGVRP